MIHYESFYADFATMIIVYNYQKSLFNQFILDYTRHIFQKLKYFVINYNGL